MADFYGDVPKNKIKPWLKKYAPQYKHYEDREFVRLIECNSYELLGSYLLRMVFLITDDEGKHVCTVRLPDAAHAMMSDVDTQLSAILVSGNCDPPQVKKFHAARYHIVSTLTYALHVVKTDKWFSRMSPYVRAFSASLRTHRKNIANDQYCETLCDRMRSFWKRFRGRISPFGSKRDVSALTASAPIILTPEEQIVAREIDALSAADVDAIQAGRNISKVSQALVKVAARDERKLDAKRRRLLSALSNAEQSPKKLNISQDVPCFHVVNSAIRNIPGYANIQIGGIVDGKFSGSYFSPKSLAVLKASLVPHIEHLKASGIRNVLLRGNLWTESCPLSGDALNADLPKWFDGMNVKFVGNARYAQKIASVVRDHFAQSEAPRVDDCEDHYDDDDNIEEDEREEQEEFEKINTNLSEVYETNPDMELLQIHYQTAFPVSASVDQEAKQEEFHGQPLDIEMPEIKLRINPDEEFDERMFMDTGYMKPTIDTHLEPRHPVNQTELIYSAYNRNYLPTKEDSMIDSFAAAENLFRTFLKLIRRKPTRIDVSDNDISKYIQKKGEVLVSDVKRLLNELPQELDRWDALVKGAAKPVLSDDEADRYAPTQVIICKDKLYNVRYGPFLSRMKTEVMKTLDKRVFVFSEDSIAGLQQKITKRISLMKGNVSEIDISKYDKSQGLTSLLFECMVFTAYGMRPDDVNDWLVSHWYARVKSITGKTAFSVPMQRKSGDPWTYFGNTLFLLTTLVSIYEERGFTIFYIMVSGDDSLIWSDCTKKDENDLVDDLTRDYNLDAKLINANSLYFCSRFLIKCNDLCYLVPDPVKILIKLGKRDARDRGHVEELRIALLDQIDTYRYLELREITEQQTRDRYDVSMVGELMSHMYALAHDKLAFDKLYVDNDESAKKAIIVPESFMFESSKRHVMHDDLVRKDISRFDGPRLGAYMRSVGSNAGKRVLVTFRKEFVPQGVHVVAEFSKPPTVEVFLELVRKYYKN